jgi:hypothetical protein
MNSFDVCANIVKDLRRRAILDRFRKDFKPTFEGTNEAGIICCPLLQSKDISKSALSFVKKPPLPEIFSFSCKNGKLYLQKEIFHGSNFRSECQKFKEEAVQIVTHLLNLSEQDLLFPE